MGIEWRKSAGGRQVMFVTGAFDFSRHREFMEQVRRYQGGGLQQGFDVDLSGVTRLDTAAVGMLLLLADRLGAADNEVTLLNCSQAAQAGLRIGGLGRRFRIA